MSTENTENLSESEVVDNLREALKHVAVAGALVEIDEVSELERDRINAITGRLLLGITEISPEIVLPLATEISAKEQDLNGVNSDQRSQNETDCEMIDLHELDRRVKDWFESCGEQATETRVDIVRTIILHFPDREFHLSELYQQLATNEQGEIDESLVANYTQVFTRSKLRALGLIEHNGKRTSKVKYSLNKELAKKHGFLVQIHDQATYDSPSITPPGTERTTEDKAKTPKVNSDLSGESRADSVALSETEEEALSTITEQVGIGQWFRRADVSFAETRHKNAFNRLMTKLIIDGKIEHNEGHARGSKYRFLDAGRETDHQREDTKRAEAGVTSHLGEVALGNGTESVKKN